MDAATKEALLARLEEYLDNLETLPEYKETEPDRFSLMVELAALKGEVKLESRQVKTALEMFRETFELLKQAHSHIKADSSKQREQETRRLQDGERGMLLEMLELRDRLQTSHGHLTRYRPNWLARQGGASAYVAEVAIGQAMLLRRLDEILARRNVQPLSALGQRFDPLTMYAVQTVQYLDREDGVVIAEIRAGFTYNGLLLRPSEVTVNKISVA